MQRKDEYGNEVQREARPLPIEYLLVDMPCGTPLDPEYTLSSRSSAHLAIENRAPSMPAQDVHAFSQYLRATLPSLFSAPANVSPLQILQVLSDLHVLFFLASNEFVPFQVCYCAIQLDGLWRVFLNVLFTGTLCSRICAQGDELQALLKAVVSGNEREAEILFHGGSWQTLLRAIEAAASSRAYWSMANVTSINDYELPERLCSRVSTYGYSVAVAAVRHRRSRSSCYARSLLGWHHWSNASAGVCSRSQCWFHVVLHHLHLPQPRVAIPVRDLQPPEECHLMLTAGLLSNFYVYGKMTLLPTELHCFF